MIQFRKGRYTAWDSQEIELITKEGTCTHKKRKLKLQQKMVPVADIIIELVRYSID